jgi:hypothetical protein
MELNRSLGTEQLILQLEVLNPKLVELELVNTASVALSCQFRIACLGMLL